MNQRYLVLKACKYILFSFALLLFVLLWKVFFILQGGIGLEGSIFLLPIKCLPLFLYSSFAFWSVLKILDYKHKVRRKKVVAFTAGLFSLILSLYFQYSRISNRAPYIFKGNMFSHVRPIKMNLDFTNRLMLSSSEYLKLMPFSNIDSDFVSYYANTMAEMALFFELKKIFDDSHLEDTCKEYLKKHEDYNDCTIDLFKEVRDHYNFTAGANIISMAVGVLGVFKVKSLLTDQYGKKDSFVFYKTANDLIETSIISIEQSKKLLLNEDEVFHFTMGYNMKRSSLVAVMERLIHYKFLTTHIMRLEEMISGMEQKMSNSKKKNKKREITSITRPKLEREKARFKRVRTLFYELQNEGFKSENVKMKFEEVREELEFKRKQIKGNSIIFKPFLFFDISLFDLMNEGFIKEKDSPPQKNHKTIKLEKSF